jgi:transcriptional regulator with XRE-family HTH domain
VLRALMDERGVSANALAHQVPCDKPLISRYLNGRQQPSGRMARRLDEVLSSGSRLADLDISPPLPLRAPNDQAARLRDPLQELQIAFVERRHMTDLMKLLPESDDVSVSEPHVKDDRIARMPGSALTLRRLGADLDVLPSA